MSRDRLPGSGRTQPFDAIDCFRPRSEIRVPAKAFIEANESGRPAVEKLEPFHPGLLAIVAVRWGHLEGALCTRHVPV